MRATPQARTLGEVIGGADVFLGLSAAGVLKGEMVAKMAARPLIFALANPDPEITPEDGRRGARRRHHGDRPQRLPQPGQQRPLLPLHLPRRARCRRHDRQRRDEDRLRARPRRARPQGAVRGRGPRLRRGGGRLRPEPDHPQAVRSAADRRARPGRGQGGDGFRRGDAADRRLRRLPPAAQPVRLQVRPGDAAGARAGARRAQAGDLQRRRGRPRAARHPDHPRRAHRACRS